MKELRIHAQNKPGELNKIATTLAKNGVNMLAVCAYQHNGEGRIHLVVNDHKKGLAVVKKMKYGVDEGDVVILTLKHSPGELARITKNLAKAKVNIEVIYGSGSTGSTAQLVLAVDSLAKAEKAIGSD